MSKGDLQESASWWLPFVLPSEKDALKTHTVVIYMAMGQSKMGVRS